MLEKANTAGNSAHKGMFFLCWRGVWSLESIFEVNSAVVEFAVNFW